MLFNSVDFFFFLPIVFLLYWFVANKKLSWQNILLLVSSYFFYACWDWRFLFLLIFSTLLDYFTGLKMADAANNTNRKFWFWLSISVNLGFLAVFKYYNFFIESFAEALNQAGVQVNYFTLNVILPVGISFYTFHGLSYVIDIYNNKIKAEKNYIDYAVFVSFFPLLVAGPIERATHLLPQIQRVRLFNYENAINGLKQILWGLFKKIVIADQCAVFANTIFNSNESLSGSTNLLGALFFTFQIYGDFSGYSDIALGTARLFGIELLQNFSFPYFSRDISEFWRRWHISLSTWFRDYLYIPLGGSKVGLLKKIRNTFIIFIVSGFWHGANWTFIFWGFLNALYIMPSIIFNTNRNNLNIVAQGKILPSIKDFLSICLTFLLTMLAWVFFRSETIGFAFHFIEKIFSESLFDAIKFTGVETIKPVFMFMLFFVLIEWIGRESKFAIENFTNKWNVWIRWVFYYGLILSLFYFSDSNQQFIYFQF